MPLNNQRIPIPQSDPSSRQNFSPSPSTSHHRLLISTESCYCCFVLFQTSAFNHSNYRCKDWCISQSCAFHFNVIQESNLRLFIHPIQRMMIALIVAASSVVSSISSSSTVASISVVRVVVPRVPATSTPLASFREVVHVAVS